MIIMAENSWFDWFVKGEKNIWEMTDEERTDVIFDLSPIYNYASSNQKTLDQF